MAGAKAGVHTLQFGARNVNPSKTETSKRSLLLAKRDADGSALYQRVTVTAEYAVDRAGFFLPAGRKPSGSKAVYVTETGGRSGSPTPPRQGGKRVVDLIEAMDKEEADADIAEIRRQHQHRRKRRIAGMMQGIFDEVEGLTREQRREVCEMPPPPQSKRSLGP